MSMCGLSMTGPFSSKTYDAADASSVSSWLILSMMWDRRGLAIDLGNSLGRPLVTDAKPVFGTDRSPVTDSRLKEYAHSPPIAEATALASSLHCSVVCILPKTDPEVAVITPVIVYM